MAMNSGEIIRDNDIYDKFAATVASAANSGILYGTNNFHFADLPTTGSSLYGGTTAGITQGTWSERTGQLIDASDIVDYIVAQSTLYCRIRNFSVTRNVTASGGPATSTETRTGVSNMVTARAATFTAPSSSNIQQGQIISAPNLVSFYTGCQTAYAASRQTATTFSYSVCHNSCHSSCHGSRGRR